MLRIMINIFLILIIALYSNYLIIKNKKYKELEYEVKEYRKIRRKLNKWRYSYNKMIEILDNGVYRLKKIQMKKSDK
jgi:hypothetical protein